MDEQTTDESEDFVEEVCLDDLHLLPLITVDQEYVLNVSDIYCLTVCLIIQSRSTHTRC